MTAPKKYADIFAGFVDKQIPSHVLLAEIEDLLRTKPTVMTIGNTSDDVLSWLGRFKAVIEKWDRTKSVFLTIDHKLASSASRDQDNAYRAIIELLHQAKSSIRLTTLDPVSVTVDQGKPFDYFNGVRGVIEAASVDVFFVDQYLDAEFAERYLPLVPQGVCIRLLAFKFVEKLVPAVEMFAKQSGSKIEVRQAKVHDRYLFVDRRECYQSGASFKDGGKSAPTLVVQITDAFEAVAKIYEEKWANAKVVRG